ncbi:MAG TPA: hypothetical protein VKU85_05415, partial [bacterium]|nr:hypothetical protein [bacterium]
GAAGRIRGAKVSPDDALEFLPLLELPGSVDPLRVGGLVAAEGLSEGEPGTLRVTVAGEPVAIARRDDEGLRVLHLFPPGPRFGRGKRAP